MRGEGDVGGGEDVVVARSRRWGSEKIIMRGDMNFRRGGQVGAEEG